ncbi:MAG: hypothetical protein K0U72_15210 [Gammaproteobacteria bacterium]|nr:hypothetical protein [Gammaproteobacteria bacterium]
MNNKVHHLISNSLRFFLVATLTYSTTVFAQSPEEESRTEISISGGYGHSDNVFRSSVTDIGSDFAVVGLVADFKLVRPKFEFSLLSDLDYLEYENSAVRDRPDGFLDALLTVNVVDDRLEWYVENNFSQIRQDASLGDTPDNLREFNILSTGLDARLPVGGRSSLDVFASFSDRSAREIQDVDSQEFSAGLGLYRQISSTRSAALILDISSIEYDDLDATEYDIQRLFVRYENELASGQVTLDLGANKIDSGSSGFNSDTNPLFRLSWQRDIAARSTVTFSTSHEINDLGASAAQRSDGGGRAGISGRLNASGSPFTETRASVTWDLNGNRTAWQLAFAGSNSQYDDPLVADFDIVSVRGSMRRELPSRWSLELSVYSGKRNTHQSIRQSRDSTGQISVRKEIGRRLGIIAGYRHERRTDNSSTGYTENQYRVDFVFGAR